MENFKKYDSKKKKNNQNIFTKIKNIKQNETKRNATKE